MNYFNADNCDFSADQIELANQFPVKPLSIRTCPTEGQFEISGITPGATWSDQYFNVSGYFGSYGPHVFAAAPELLEALKSVLTQFEIVLPSSGLTHDERQAIIDARAAIAKATGTQTS